VRTQSVTFRVNRRVLYDVERLILGKLRTVVSIYFHTLQTAGGASVADVAGGVVSERGGSESSEQGARRAAAHDGGEVGVGARQSAADTAPRVPRLGQEGARGFPRS